MVNFGNMMKQAQQLQKKMADVQEKLNSIEVEGVSGGGLVKVVSTAKGEIKRIKIDESILKPEEKEIALMKNDPAVRQILDTYSGATIHSISTIGETVEKQINKKESQHLKE
jgi:hypothetical protein